MKVAVVGLGYVGTVSAACLADMGHTVLGVDINPAKVEAITRGVSPISEPDLDALLHTVVGRGSLRATADPVEAVATCDVSLICVATPSRPNGALDLRHLSRAVAQVAEGLKARDAYHVVAIRSTVLPGRVREELVPALEAGSGKQLGSDFGLCVNPEFLRESSAIRDFRSPPFTVIGQWDAASGDGVAAVYEQLRAPVLRMTLEDAAMVKYASNAFHALKVAFANEMGVMCKELGADAHRVMEVFCRDQALNISPVYLRPGFAFGGSCLPKDVRALAQAARSRDVAAPVLRAILSSNDIHLRRAVDMIAATGKRRVGLLGLGFKPGTDDLRESPFVLLAEALVGRGYTVKIYDEDVRLSNLVGRNREYMEQHLPHLARLLTGDLVDLVASSDVLVVGKENLARELHGHRLTAAQTVIELVRVGGWEPAASRGIAW